ncbi:hypothetical protein [Microbulbifer sp. 2205BS26-8]|uniref:hypothetical protein n=1 Tax=Microbulbifer sp. 2205BS26-8 TaxID=3064386 RepID=UPI00273F2673|nr:hypothetical protein [Microbulbifer sp. 2205BS26-8]MDP5208635.1 hypothetical protein [Microbulbifer sp. 2205BS26-8]
MASTGCIIRTETQGLHKTIYADREYDNLGRLTFVSEPYFIGNSRLWTKTDYDLLGRPTRVTAPDGSQATMEYLGLKTITTNNKGQQKTEYKNVAGELVDAINGRLTYEYDSQGNLHKAKSWGKTNSAGSHIDEGDGHSYPIVVTINYDHLGRKTDMDDPDKGAWEYTYTRLLPDACSTRLPQFWVPLVSRASVTSGIPWATSPAATTRVAARTCAKASAMTTLTG